MLLGRFEFSQSRSVPCLLAKPARVILLRNLGVHLDQLPGSFFGPSNLVDLLRHRAAHQGQDRAFSYLVDGESEEVQWTYQELDRRARSIGAWLQMQSLEGERALLLYPAGLDFIAAF